MKQKFTIKDLSEGKCAVINDGTVEQLRKVLKLAFPKHDLITLGLSKYYYKSKTYNQRWASSQNYNNLVIVQSVKDFLEPEFKRGDRVLVSADGENWKNRIHLTTVKIENTENLYICVDGDSEYEYKENCNFNTVVWRKIKPLEEITEYSLEDIAKLVNKPVELIRIKK